jgi:hypothetical protein
MKRPLVRVRSRREQRIAFQREIAITAIVILMAIAVCGLLAHAWWPQ